MWLEIFLGFQIAVMVILITQRWHPRKQLKLWSNSLIIAALVYIVFVIFTQHWSSLSIEILGVFGYSALALIGYRSNPFLITLGWLLHVGWDIFIHYPESAIAPHWYPGICLGFDLAIAGYLVYLITSQNLHKTKEAQSVVN